MFCLFACQKNLQDVAIIFFLGIPILPVAGEFISWIKTPRHGMARSTCHHHRLHPSAGTRVRANAARTTSRIATPALALLPQNLSPFQKEKGFGNAVRAGPFSNAQTRH